MVNRIKNSWGTLTSCLTLFCAILVLWNFEFGTLDFSGQDWEDDIVIYTQYYISPPLWEWRHEIIYYNINLSNLFFHLSQSGISFCSNSQNAFVWSGWSRWHNSCVITYSIQGRGALINWVLRIIFPFGVQLPQRFSISWIYKDDGATPYFSNRAIIGSANSANLILAWDLYHSFINSFALLFGVHITSKYRPLYRTLLGLPSSTRNKNWRPR